MNLDGSTGWLSFSLSGANPPKDVPAALDAAVPAASGFCAKQDFPAQLLALNQEVAAKIERKLRTGWTN